MFLALNADDLLTAHHTKGSRYTKIRLPLFNMFRVDLTLPPDRSKKLAPGESRKRRGIYLDDVMWKVAGKLLRALMYENVMSMMLLLSASTAKNLKTTTIGSEPAQKLLAPNYGLGLRTNNKKEKKEN